MVFSRDVTRTRLNLTYIFINHLHVFDQGNCVREDSYHIQLIHLIQWYRRLIRCPALAFGPIEVDRLLSERRLVRLEMFERDGHSVGMLRSVS